MFTSIHCIRGQVVYHEDEPAKYFYIVFRGEFSSYKKFSNNNLDNFKYDQMIGPERASVRKKNMQDAEAETKKSP